MKKTLALLLLSFLFMACPTENKNEITLFNNFSFKLNENEKIGNITPDIIETYSSCCNNEPSVQIPLYRVVKHADYLLFIGIPVNTSIDRITDKKMGAMKGIFYEKSAGLDLPEPKEFSGSHKVDDGRFLSQYAKKLDDQNLIYVAVLTTSKTLTGPVLSSAEIAGRIVSRK